MNFISNRWLLSAASISVAALVAACGGSSTPPPVAQATLVAVATPSSFCPHSVKFGIEYLVSESDEKNKKLMTFKKV